MYELILHSDFAAAHRLREYDGACENLHGHNWRVELEVAGERTNHLGMVIDFRELKAILKRVLERFDHTYLNDLACFEQVNPTTENLAAIIYRECAKQMPAEVCVKAVTVWESSRCGAKYME